MREAELKAGWGGSKVSSEREVMLRGSEINPGE